MRFECYIGMGLLVLIMVALILWPKGADLERLNNMFERGQYEAVCAQLELALEDKPNWYEARKLMVSAALGAGQLDLALTHLVALQETGPTGTEEKAVSDWLVLNCPTPAQGDNALAIVRDNIEDSSRWAWIKEFYVKLLIKLERPQDIPDALELIISSEQGRLSDSLMNPVALGWEYVAECQGLIELWQLSSQLDYSIAESSVPWTWRGRVLGRTLFTEVAELQKEFPGDPVLAAGLALYQQDDAGLEFLRQWEADYTVDGTSLPWFSTVKFDLLRSAQSVGPDDFSHITPNQLLQLAADSTHEPGKCRVILSYLEEGDYYPQQVGILRAALKGPNSVLSLAAYEAVLSSDGNWLSFKLDATTGKIYNLKTEESYTLRSLFFGSTWMWAPDSSQVAYISEYYPEIIEIFDTRGVLLSRVEFQGYYLLLGWRDAKTIWVQEYDPRYRSFLAPPLLCDLKSGRLFPSPEDFSSSSVNLSPGPRGFLAWEDNGEIWLKQGKELSTLQGGSTVIVSWIPDGRGLVLNRDGELYLWTGAEPEPLGMQGVSFIFLGWRNEKEFYYGVEIEETHSFRVMSYNIRTQGVTEYNLVGSRWLAAAGKTAVSSSSGMVEVYRLP